MRGLYDKCIMTLPPATKSELNDGVILIEVDDILEGGNSRHREIIDQFYTKYH